MSAYRKFFGSVPPFGCDDNALVFDAALLDLLLIQRDDELRLLMEARAQSQIDRLQAMPPLLRQVVAEIRLRLPRAVCTIAGVADAVGMSERSLRRHLQAEGRSFQTLLSQVRHEQALAYLRDPALSVLEVALLLGYAEQSAFSAAFRSWTGCSPREYQREVRTRATSAPVAYASAPCCDISVLRDQASRSPARLHRLLRGRRRHGCGKCAGTWG